MNLAAIVLSTLLAAVPLGPGDHVRTFQHDGRSRSYLVHIPPQYDPKKPTPVVLAFHGGGGNAESMVLFCGLNKTADKEGFITVYPDGTGPFEKIKLLNQRRRAYVAGQGYDQHPGQIDPQHFGQRTDVGVLQAASDEVGFF